MKKYIGKEIGIHGSEWDSWNDGYFSSPLVATPFLAKIHESLSLSHPDVIVDLGGGTGFLLSELAKELPQTNIRFVNLDCSDAQLAIAQTRGIHCVHSSLWRFQEKLYRQGNKTVPLPYAIGSPLFWTCWLEAIAPSPACSGKRRRIFYSSDSLFREQGRS